MKLMDNQELPPQSAYPESVEATPFVSKVLTLLDKNKAVLILGQPQLGKTTLAMLSVKELERRAEEGEKVYSFFTTPAIQETFAASKAKDRTGVVYDHLPRASDMPGDGLILIVIDEISSRDPMSQTVWKNYINLPNAKFILLGNQDRPAVESWRSLFQQDQIQIFDLVGAKRKNL